MTRFDPIESDTRTGNRAIVIGAGLGGLAAAMRLGAKDADAYLAEWRKAAPYQVEGDANEVAEAEATRLDTEYDRERVRKLIANNGWA